MSKTTTANKITILRIAIVPFFLLLAYTDRHFAAFVLYVIACLSDMADGYIARHYNQTSNFGKFMDPLADKILVISAMAYFVQMQRFPGWALALVCFREFAVSGLRLVAAEKGIVIAAAKSGKLKTGITMIGLGAMILFNMPTVDLFVIIAILASTVYSGFEYFYVNKSVFKD